MPDISLCTNDACPLAKKCYRHEAEPGPWQAFSHFTPDPNGSCKHHLPIWGNSSKVTSKSGKTASNS